MRHVWTRQIDSVEELPHDENALSELDFKPVDNRGALFRRPLSQPAVFGHVAQYPRLLAFFGWGVEVPEPAAAGVEGLLRPERAGLPFMP